VPPRYDDYVSKMALLAVASSGLHALVTGLGVCVAGTCEILQSEINSGIIQKRYDLPAGRAPAYHIQLDDGKLVTLRW